VYPSKILVFNRYTLHGIKSQLKDVSKSLLLISRFNKGLEKVKKKGIYRQLIEKWKLTDTEIREVTAHQ